MLGDNLKESSSFLSRLKVFAILLVVIALVIFIGYQVYLMFNKTRADKYFGSKETFGILVAGQVGEKKKTRTTFISVATIVPKTRRIGFISFYPQVKLGKEEATIGQRASFSNIDDIVSDLESLLQIQIPFYFAPRPGDVARMIDLVEGLQYFMYEPQTLEKENLPTGEFTLDGSLAGRLLAPPESDDKDLIAASLLYRYYSFLLNLWQVREAKWAILENPDIFKLAAGQVKTNLKVNELYTLASEFFSNDKWLPLFIEMPIKRDQSDYFIDRDAAKLFLKNFQKTMVSNENPFFDEQPKMEIKNGTDIPGLAKKMRKKLSRKGIRVLEFSNADSSDYKNSILLGMSANSYFLDNVAKMLKPRKVYHAVNRSLFTDLTLVVGADYKVLKVDR